MNLIFHFSLYPFIINNIKPVVVIVVEWKISKWARPLILTFSHSYCKLLLVKGPKNCQREQKAVENRRAGTRVGFRPKKINFFKKLLRKIKNLEKKQELLLETIDLS